MALQILNASGDSEDGLVGEMKSAIEEKVPGAQANVTAVSPGHFELRVVSQTFAGLSLVKQQQLVYGAIAGFMSGDSAPVHAIDFMETRTP